MGGRLVVVDGDARLVEGLRRNYLSPLRLDPGPRLVDRLRLARPDAVIHALGAGGRKALLLAGHLRTALCLAGVPYIAVADDEVAAIRAWEIGADDVIRDTASPALLAASVRRLLRRRALNEGLKLHSATAADLLGDEPLAADGFGDGRIVVCGPDGRLDRIGSALRAALASPVQRATGLDAVTGAIAEGVIDAVVLAGDGDGDPLALAAGLRAEAGSEDLALLILSGAPAADASIRAVDLGLADMVSGLDPVWEIAARLRALLRQRAFTARLLRGVRRAETLAMSDGLTGLANRRYALCHLARLVNGSHRSGSPLSLMMIDLDGLKRLNDDAGHPAGDALLVSSAAAIEASLRPADLAARLGGDEFLVALPGSGPAETHAVAERLRTGIAARAPGGGMATASVGLATLSPGEDRDALIARADAALYSAKRAGGNRVTAAALPSVRSRALTAGT